ncbi:hypothetical protein [Ensifer aridi]|uniref:hypothetical protein n=1 Tax=Ensifer aridi TaxID=1708715 RepID=UPI000A120A25|nr:hypothetical protein [Ensifer aridi]
MTRKTKTTLPPIVFDLLRNTGMPAAAALLAVSMYAPAIAQSPTDQIVTETIDFEKSDADATATARKMYGREFRVVQANRVWLEEPTDGYDQIVVRLGEARGCATGCYVAALYYDDKQWLEVWRMPGKTVGLGAVGVTGMKPIFDGRRLWQWSGTAYMAQPVPQERKNRTPTEEELKAATRVLKERFKGGSEPLEPSNVSAQDLNLKSGDEAAILISSTYYCGNSACPVVFLDGKKQVIDVVLAWGPDFSVIDERDENDRRMVEVATRDGVATYSLGEKEPRSVIEPMKITIAGQKR